MCNLNVRSRAALCDICQYQVHYRCDKLSVDEINLIEGGAPYTCKSCCSLTADEPTDTTLDTVVVKPQQINAQAPPPNLPPPTTSPCPTGQRSAPSNSTGARPKNPTHRGRPQTSQRHLAELPDVPVTFAARDFRQSHGSSEDLDWRRRAPVPDDIDPWKLVDEKEKQLKSRERVIKAKETSIRKLEDAKLELQEQLNLSQGLVSSLEARVNTLDKENRTLRLKLTAMGPDQATENSAATAAAFNPSIPPPVQQMQPHSQCSHNTNNNYNNSNAAVCHQHEQQTISNLASALASLTCSSQGSWQPQWHGNAFRHGRKYNQHGGYKRHHNNQQHAKNARPVPPYAQRSPAAAAGSPQQHPRVPVPAAAGSPHQYPRVPVPVQAAQQLNSPHWHSPALPPRAAHTANTTTRPKCEIPLDLSAACTSTPQPAPCSASAPLDLSASRSTHKHEQPDNSMPLDLSASEKTPVAEVVDLSTCEQNSAAKATTASTDTHAVLTELTQINSTTARTSSTTAEPEQASSTHTPHESFLYTASLSESPPLTLMASAAMLRM